MPCDCFIANVDMQGLEKCRGEDAQFWELGAITSIED
jgi:hypothetical protein